jgi:hypothetical protein
MTMKPKKSGIPHNAVCFFQDGDKWCCVYGDFVDLQESFAGFGATFEESMANLASESRPNSPRGISRFPRPTILPKEGA